MNEDFGNTYEDSQEVVSSGGDGFGSTSEGFAKVVFISRNEDNEENCWYMLEGDKDKPIKRWINSDYLQGTIEAIRITNQVSQKHGTVVKISVIIAAGGTRYSVRSTLLSKQGEPTVFARGLLSQLLVCDGPRIKLIVRPSEQDSKIVFPSIIQNGKTVQEKGSQWIGKDADFIDLARAVADKLGVTFEDKTGDAPPAQRQAPAQRSTQPTSDDKAKAVDYVLGKLDEAGIPAKFREAVIRRLLGNPSFTLSKIDMPTAKIFKSAILDANGKATNFAPLRDALAIVNPPVEDDLLDDDDQFPAEPEGGAPWDDNDDPL